MRVLMVDDNPLWCDMVSTYLDRDDIATEIAATLAEARHKLSVPPHILILDQQLPDGEGLELAQEMLEAGLETRILVVTGHPHIDDAVQALRLRIDDYLSKPVELEVIRHAVLRSAESLRLERLDALQKRNTEHDRMAVQIVGKGLEPIRALVEKIGRASCPVLITGETGSGKSLVAKAIHYANGASDRPFVKLNCAALPEGLVESELFGVEKGAFTGASSNKPGLFELAHGGTLFLDEIGELSPVIQAKLLGVLEDGEARRVGGTKSRRFDVRVLAATNVNLEEAIADGRFRRDLYFRLNIGRLEIPALRDRLGDVQELIDTLLDGLRVKQSSLAEGELDSLLEYDWPGNVRELRNVLERSILLQEGDHLRPSSLLPVSACPGRDSRESGDAIDEDVPAPRTLGSMERTHILSTLARFDGHRRQTADALGIGVATLRRKLKDFRSN